MHTNITTATSHSDSTMCLGLCNKKKKDQTGKQLNINVMKYIRYNPVETQAVIFLRKSSCTKATDMLLKQQGCLPWVEFIQPHNCEKR